MEQRDLTYYIFNNRADFQQYNDILGANSDRAEGVIVNNRNIVTFRSRAMDNILAHEITHLLQAKFAPQAIRSFASQTPEVIPYFIGEKVEELNNEKEKLNNEKMQAAKSSSEAENGRRRRRSIDQSHIEPPFSTNSDNQALAPNTTRALPSLNLESKIKNNQATSGASKPSSWINVFANTIVDAVKGVSQFISSPFKPAYRYEAFPTF
ncbi:hypothetical protein [Wolbachia endosymbiont (group A) of Clivina fossor]|uniref:hypothetical protein n=1 Tax=Wolbachia endosymbiont (group A) of Clivina fossor TaxID=3066133 RepID=UPI003132CDA6